MQDKWNVTKKLRSLHRRIRYTPGLWDFYKSAWVSLPGQCQGKLFDVYSLKCWTTGSSQCGSYSGEGSCYNREHSWPKSWWGRHQNDAYSDVFHVFPSDGYVNGQRGSYPFGEVASPTFVSSEGHKKGPCTTPGYSGTCFEPTDRVKGLMARGHLYFSLRYMDQLGCCSKDAVFGAAMEPWTVALMLKWNAAHPVKDWEWEFNQRAQRSQGTRNPFIDFQDLAGQVYR